MTYYDVLLLLLGVSVALHAATASALLTLRTGRSHAESFLAAGGAVAAVLSLWLATVGPVPVDEDGGASAPASPMPPIGKNPRSRPIVMPVGAPIALPIRAPVEAQ